MKERPILFNGGMVNAILEGRKTQTRRVIKPQPISVERCRELTGAPYSLYTANDHPNKWRVAGPCGVVLRESGLSERGWYDWACPYGQPGDRLWVRETWAERDHMDIHPPSNITPTHQNMRWFKAGANQCSRPDNMRGKWRPSIHMPRWASRITLEVVSVRVERVQEISCADSIAEGIRPTANSQTIDCDTDDPRHGFEELWDSINAKRGFGWDVNPWVWVVEFKTINPQPTT